MHVRLAQKYGTGSFQPSHHFGILFGYAVLKHRAAGCRFDPCCIEEVLQSNGNAVERTTPFLLLNFRIRLLRGLNRDIACDRDVGVQCWVEFFDALQNGPSDLDRRDLPGANEFAQLSETQEREIVLW